MRGTSSPKGLSLDLEFMDFEYENCGAAMCGPTGLAAMLLSEAENANAFGRGMKGTSSTGSNFFITGSSIGICGILYSICGIIGTVSIYK